MYNKSVSALNFTLRTIKSPQLLEKRDYNRQLNRNKLSDEYIRSVIYASVYGSTGEKIDKNSISEEEITQYKEGILIKRLSSNKEHLKETPLSVKNKIAPEKKSSLIQETLIINDDFRTIINNKEQIIHHLDMLKALLIQL